MKPTREHLLIMITIQSTPLRDCIVSKRQRRL
nr:MAG TPA: hypothetical protein [Caudoviricetes sp.]